MPSNTEAEVDAKRPATAGRGRGHGPERVTVNLTTRTSRALEHVVGITGDSKTDAINRAIQVYDYLEEVIGSGGTVFIKRGDDAVPEQVRFF